MYKLLELYNFVPKFCGMIKICQVDLVSKVINNGYLSEEIYIQKGLRQGDPLSCLLFDLVVEPLAIKIRNESKIQGINIGKRVKKLAQYADDLWISMLHKKQCYEALFEIFHDYTTFIGLKINYNKTEVLRIGSLRNTDASYYTELPLFWSDGPIKILGMMFTGNIKEYKKINCENMLNKAENLFKICNKRTLTMLGKIVVVNTLVIPLFIYRFQVLPTPDKVFFLKFRKIVQTFIWNGKRPKIAYHKLTCTYDNAGLKLVDLELKILSLKVKWIQVMRLRNTLLMEVLQTMSPIAIEDLIHCNFAPRDVVQIFRVKDHFIVDMMIAWAKFNFVIPLSKEDLF